MNVKFSEGKTDPTIETYLEEVFREAISDSGAHGSEFW
jgi:hypothetical protein